MKLNSVLRNLLMLQVLATTGLLVGCFHDDDGDDNNDEMSPPAMSMFEITVTNATSHQPLTPVAVVAHTSGYSSWTLGGGASVGLEMLAEGGDVSQFLTEAGANADVLATAWSMSDPFGPGASQTVMIESMHDADLRISVATMLANTNDAFTGLSGVSVGSLMPGESISMMGRVYDAGTEGNSETAETMPGPVANGTGFDAARDDKNFVAIHPGVVTMDDGLVTSVLNETHRWLGEASKITITRMQ